MSANEDELPEVHGSGTGELIGEEWEDFQEIIEGLPCGVESPVERYDDFDNATEFINYVQRELELGEEDIDRVLDEYENAKCPYCEEENLYAMTGDMDSTGVDPTLETSEWTNERDSFRDDYDTRMEGVFLAYCTEHEEAFFEFSESWHEEEG